MNNKERAIIDQIALTVIEQQTVLSAEQALANIKTIITKYYMELSND